MILFIASVSAYAVSSPRVQSDESYRKSIFDRQHVDENGIVEYFGCGTECEAIHIFDKQSGEMKAVFTYGVGHRLSPDRTRFAAFHSRVGITVGDREGDILFQDSFSAGTSDDPLVDLYWSPDSSKLAAVLKEDGASHFDVYVYHVDGGYMRLAHAQTPAVDDYPPILDTHRRQQFVGGYAINF